MQPQIHESYSRDKVVAPGSNRSFGIVMAAALSLVSLFNYWHDGRVWPWTGGVAVMFLATACLYPPALKSLNWIWFKFGLLLHSVLNPIVMGLLFYVTVLPTGLVMRAMGKDPMRLRRERGSDSYWIIRSPPGPAPKTMKDQF